MDPQKILDYGAKLIVIFMCIPIHEYAHAWAATKLGDDTPRYQGRLSLNPLAHLDPIGALCIFFIGFGWGKPVQVNPIRFKNYRKGMALTAAAGPISNIIMGLIGIVLYKLFYVLYIVHYSIALYYVSLILYYFTAINVGLAVFNLIHYPEHTILQPTYRRIKNACYNKYHKCNSDIVLILCHKAIFLK